MDDVLKRFHNIKMKTRPLNKENLFLTVPNTPHSVQFSPSTLCLSQKGKSTPRKTKQSWTQNLLAQSKQQLKRLRSIENGLHVTKMYQRFEAIDTVLFVLVLINYVAIHVYAELQLQLVNPVLNGNNVDTIVDPANIQINSMFSSYILWMNFILTFFIIGASLLRHEFQKDFQRLQKKPHKKYSQIFEILLISVQPYPFFQNSYTSFTLEQSSIYEPIQMKSNLVLVVFGSLKLFLLIRYIFWRNLWRFINVKSQKFFRPSYNRICKIYGSENGYIHIMKCLFRENFVAFIFQFYAVTMAIIAYNLRLAESHFDGRFMNILNCMWFTMVSMTTVGYGDTTVGTPIGIGLDIALMISGVIITSMLISALNDLFTLNYRIFLFILGEKRALTLHSRLRSKEQLKEMAALIVGKIMTRRFRQRKYGIAFPPTQQEIKTIRNFRDLRLSLRCRKQNKLDLYRDMLNQFQSLKLHMGQLSTVCTEDIGILAQKVRVSLNGQRREGLRMRPSDFLKLSTMKVGDSNFNENLKKFMQELDADKKSAQQESISSEEQAPPPPPVIVPKRNVSKKFRAYSRSVEWHKIPKVQVKDELFIFL